MQLLGYYEVEPPIYCFNGDNIGIGHCSIQIIGSCMITGYMLWKDEYGRGYLSIVDGLRTSPYDDGPYYRVSLPGDNEIGSFIEISMEEWGTEAHVFLYPMLDQAWSTPGW